MVDAELLGEAHRAVHQRPPDTASAERREDVRRDDLDGGLEVEGGERRDLQQHRARHLAVVLGDHDPGAGVGLGGGDHLLEVVDLLLVVDPAQGLAPQLGQQRGVGADGQTQGDQRATHPTAFLGPVGR